MKKTITKPRSLRVLIVLLATIFSVQHNNAQTGWRPMGPNDYDGQPATNFGGGVKLALAADGTPYMAYHDSGNNNLPVVKRFNGTIWEEVDTQVIPVDNFYIYSLAIAPNNDLYLAGVYIISDENGNNPKACILKYDGVSWTEPGISSFFTDFMQIAVAPNGTPYIAYNNLMNQDLIVRKLTGSGWDVVGSSAVTNLSNGFSLAIAPDNTPYVGYSDFALFGAPIVKKLVGSNWSIVGAAGFIGEIFTPSISVASGTPYFAGGLVFNEINPVVNVFNGNSWVDVGSGDFSDIEVRSIKMAVAPDETPYIAFVQTLPGAGGVDVDKTTVMKFENNNWITVGSAGFSAGALYLNTDLQFAIMQDGNKAVVAYESSVGVPPFGNVFGIYAKYFNLNCNTAAPAGETHYNMTEGISETLNNLNVTGENIKWYATPADVDAGITLPAETILVNNVTYYATQTIDNCESTNAHAVTASVPLSLDKEQFEITSYPNPVTGILTVKAMGISNVKVFSLTGQLLIDKSYNADVAEVDMEPLSEGSYMVMITTDRKTSSHIVLKNK